MCIYVNVQMRISAHLHIIPIFVPVLSIRSAVGSQNR